MILQDEIFIQMADVSVDLVQGDSASFFNVLSKVVADIQSAGNIPHPGHSSFSQFTYLFRDNYTYQADYPDRGIRIGRLYPDSVDPSVLNLSPKKAAKKILKGDNYIHADNPDDRDTNLAKVYDFTLDAGKGDDIIHYNEDGHTGAVIKGGKGDDIIKISNRGNSPQSSDIDTYISTAPAAIGGKGDDVFLSSHSGYGTVIIKDYEIGKDVIGVNRFNSKKQKPIHKTRVIEGDLYIFDRKTMHLDFIVENISNSEDIEFVNSKNFNIVGDILG